MHRRAVWLVAVVLVVVLLGLTSSGDESQTTGACSCVCACGTAVVISYVDPVNEIVCLVNRGWRDDQAVELGDWSLSDNNDTLQLNSEWDLSAREQLCISLRGTGIQLSRNADCVCLRNGDGQIADCFSWGGADNSGSNAQCDES